APLCSHPAGRPQATPGPEDAPMIEYVCPECGESREVPDDMVGRKIRCNACKQAGHVPEAPKRIGWIRQHAIPLAVGGAALLLFLLIGTTVTLVLVLQRFQSLSSESRSASARQPETTAAPRPSPAPVAPAAPEPFLLIDA